MHPHQLCLLVAQMCTCVNFCFETTIMWSRENVAHDRAFSYLSNLKSSSSATAFQTGTHQTRELRQGAQNVFDRLLNIPMFCSPMFITMWSEVVLTLCSCSSCCLSPCMHAHNAINEKHCVTGQGQWRQRATMEISLNHIDARVSLARVKNICWSRV